MRIFRIHKSKSKKQISEKSPKLAAKKFLEKRKVGTVIYLHEHPSGKIHGPYRKEYDKKIMKGGLSIIDFRVDRIPRQIYPPILKSPFEPQMSDLPSIVPKQLIIKQTNVEFFGEPRFFFGDNTMIDQQNNYYYTFNCKNKDKFDRKIDNLILFRKLTPIPNSSPRIDVLTDVEVKAIPAPILLGFYTQYINYVKSKIFYEQDYSSKRKIPIKLIYMRRLFYYLLLNIFPIITQYILLKYGLMDIVENNKKKKITSLTEDYDPEIIYFFNIINFIYKINLVDLVNSIVSICKLSSNNQKLISDKLNEELSIFRSNFAWLSIQEQKKNIIQSTTEIQNMPDPIYQVEQLTNSIPMSAQAPAPTPAPTPAPAPAQEGISTPLTSNISQGFAMSGANIFEILEICFNILILPFKLIGCILIGFAKIFAFFAV